jgi:hypothetical protein
MWIVAEIRLMRGLAMSAELPAEKMASLVDGAE